MMFAKTVLTISLLTSAFFASAVIVPTSDILENNETYFMDKTTYVDWLKVTDAAQSAELVSGHQWRVASYEILREMLENVAQGRELKTGTISGNYSPDYTNSNLYLRDFISYFGNNVRSVNTANRGGSGSTSARTAGWTVGSGADAGTITHFNFGHDKVRFGATQDAYNGFYYEGPSAYQTSSISSQPTTFMYRANADGVANNLVTGLVAAELLSDVSAPILGGALMMTFGLLGMRKRQVK